MKRTLCCDFDGVLHYYRGEWKGASVIEGSPVDGAIAWLNRIRDDFDVVIFTTRGQTILGQEAVRRWLEKHGATDTDMLTITDEKPPALAYLDDRAIRFEGPGTFPTAEDIYEARPWNR